MIVNPPAIQTRTPLAFLILLAVLSLPFFVLGAVFGAIRVGAVDLPASAVMFVLPGIAAAILTYREAGRGGLRRLLRSALDYSAAQRVWYLAALVIPSAVAALAYVIARVSGWVDADFSTSLALLPVLLVATLIAAACEELGWTAYATDPLQARRGATATGVFLGICWAVWHLVPLLQVGHSVGWIAGWFLGTVAARMIIVSLHNRTDRGVLAPILLHAMVNVSAALTPAYDDPAIPIGIGLLTLIPAVALTVPGRRD
ncbi:CPBP family glutamic-type intramembrane protease [Nocardia sp. NPDC051756]|uniref:CPBP family glutamic-type intramembrane protease n=1 Tax=Nocardia sp. NPDC051756 TaxID=3154751 RepID=UPI00344A2569